ncbi:MAG: ABC transporter ATP-binding protein, partial [Nocardia sp.]|nr:ABC transporter ATP-binding protein [Nocardia sp.]
VARSGILVFASHSNEFLAQLCDTALWIDLGQVRLHGGIEEVVRAYEGPEAGNHVATVLREIEAEKSGSAAEEPAQRPADGERELENNTA